MWLLYTIDLEFYVLILTRNCLDYKLSIFFINASGHSDHN
jgi:hypothetical protein